MKFLYLLVALALFNVASSQLAGGWTQVDANTTDLPTIAAMNFGAQWVAEQANLIGGLSNGTITITNIWDIQQQVVNGMNYLFDVSFSDAKGTTINAQYIVYTQPATNTTEVMSYSYEYDTSDANVETEVNWSESNNEYSTQDIYLNGATGGSNLETFDSEDILIEGGWAPLDVSTATNDTDLQSALNAGIAFVTQQGITEGFIADGNWTLGHLLSASEQVVEGTNYAFDVELTNGSESAWASFIVWSRPWLSAPEVTAWGFFEVADVSQ